MFNLPLPSNKRILSRFNLFTFLILAELMNPGFSYGQEVELSMPIIFWGEPQGEVLAVVNSQTEELLGVHKDALNWIGTRAHTTRELLDKTSMGAYLSLEQWKSLGWNFSLDSPNLTLILSLDTKIERPLSFSLIKSRDTRGTQEISGADFSAFLNSEVVLDQISTWTPAKTLYQFPWSWEGKLGVSILGDWSLLTGLIVAPQTVDPVTLTEARLIYDQPRESIEIHGGSTPSMSYSFVQIPSLWGLTIGTNHSMKPEQVVQSLGAHVLTLTTPSQIILRQNGQILDRVLAPAGLLELKDFPLRQGQNEIELEVIDAMGISTLQTLNIPFMTDLLAPGVSSWWGSLGAVFRNPEKWLAGASFRHGLNHWLTGGVGLVLDDNEALLAFDASMATEWGSIRTDGAFGLDWSSSQPQATGAFSLSHQWQSPQNPSLPRVQWGIQGRGSRFRSPTAFTTSVTPASLSLQATLSQPLFPGWMGSLSGRATFKEGVEKVEYQGALQMSARIFPSLSLGFQGSLQEDSLDGFQWQGSISLYWTPKESAMTAGLSQDVILGKTQVQWNQSWEPSEVSQMQVSAIAGGNLIQGDPQNLGASLRYVNPAVETSLVHNTTWLRETESGASFSSYRLASALAFADGTFSLSRPVRGPFVVTRAHPLYQEFQPSLRAENGGGQTPIFWWGSGALINLRPWTSQILAPQSEALPPGYSLGPGAWMIHPGRYQGFKLSIGSPRVMLLRTRLYDLEGNVVSLKAGELKFSSPVDSEDELWSQTFFTNRQGIVDFQGLEPGAYWIEMRDGRKARFFLDSDPKVNEALTALFLE